MKQTKKGVSFLLAIVMVLSLAHGFEARAAASVTITLRIEQDGATMAAPVSITLTDEDTSTGYGIDLATGPAAEVATPLHALAKYMKSKGATDDTMSRYISVDRSWGRAFINGISTEGACGEGTGGSPSSSGLDGVSWMFAVNHTAPANPENKDYLYAVDEYILKQNDQVIFYGMWYSSEEEVLYGYFDQTAYTVEAGQALTVTLLGNGTKYDAANDKTISYTKPVDKASVIAAEYKTADSSATKENALLTVQTGTDGKASLIFPKAGSYVISACKYAADGTHLTLTRPYARITVTEPKKDDTPPVTDTIKKPAKVTKLIARVKKSKKKKKTVTLSWKKVKNATGYNVYVSKKKKSGYKKSTSVKKKTASIRLKKGTYYIKVRAWTKSGSTTRYGDYSNPLKVKVKK